MPHSLQQRRLRPFSVGLSSLEKPVALESRCWKQQKWSFLTCNLNRPSPASSQSSIHTSAYGESSEVFLSFYSCSVTRCVFDVAVRLWSQFRMNGPLLKHSVETLWSLQCCTIFQQRPDLHLPFNSGSFMWHSNAENDSVFLTPLPAAWFHRCHVSDLKEISAANIRTAIVFMLHRWCILLTVFRFFVHELTSGKDICGPQRL